MGRLKEFMGRRINVSKWTIANVFMAGAFCGTALGVVFMWSAVLV